MSRVGDYRDWNPGLLHDERTLGEVVGSLPGYAPSDVPWLIRVFENPSSRWALPGAITLARHDALHAALGRGLSMEDEGFVIGFTMGASDGVENAMTKLLRATQRLRGRTGAKALRDAQFAAYEWIATRAYPRRSRFSPSDLVAFRLGVGAGQRNRARNLETLPLDGWGGCTLGEVRRACGIDRDALESAYMAERALVGGPAAARLDTGPAIDHSHVDGTNEGPQARQATRTTPAWP